MYRFGYNRVVEPQGFIPISSWKLDNSKAISSREVRLSISMIKLEEGSFRQLYNMCGYDETRIKNRIMDIVKKRGKLHNPTTDSGGICYGTVDQIGAEYQGKEMLSIGDEVICITSLTAIPIHIENIKAIHFNYGQIEVEGYAILFESTPFIQAPLNINLNCAMYAFDESGSLAKARTVVKPGQCIMIMGSEILSVLFYSAAIKHAVNGNCRVVAVLDKVGVSGVAEDEIENLLGDYVDAFYLTDVVGSMSTYKKIRQEEFGNCQDNFDTSIICGNLLGAEVISVLLTKDKGTLFFTSLINNYNLILLFAESVGKSVNVIALEEYREGFPSVTLALMHILNEKLIEVDRIYNNDTILNKLPTSTRDLINNDGVTKLGDYIFASPKTGEMLAEVINIASYDCSVIIHGETGVGKEKILELIHQNSKRRTNACVRINCATIQETLAESEFFGYEPGSFTGANAAGKRGYFELANHGILFLDEVGELSLPLQTKLLRVIQDNQFYRVGGQTPVKVNVRVICASNISLRELVKQGKFREDLYYRLNICEINIAPLRERKADIACLADHFLARYNEQYMQNKRFNREAHFEMASYSWPGNVRELENTVHRAFIANKADVMGGEAVRRAISRNLYAEALPEKSQSAGHDVINLSEAMAQHERAIIEEVLKRGVTTREAAKILDISQSQLVRKKTKYNL